MSYYEPYTETQYMHPNMVTHPSDNPLINTSIQPIHYNDNCLSAPPHSNQNTYPSSTFYQYQQSVQQVTSERIPSHNKDIYQANPSIGNTQNQDGYYANEPYETHIKSSQIPVNTSTIKPRYTKVTKPYMQEAYDYGKDPYSGRMSRTTSNVPYIQEHHDIGENNYLETQNNSHRKDTSTVATRNKKLDDHNKNNVSSDKQKASKKFIPCHIQKDHPDFDKSVPSPFMLYYFDDSAPNDCLLKNKFLSTSKPAIPPSIRRGKRDMACCGGESSDFRVYSDVYYENLKHPLRLKTTNQNLILGPNLAWDDSDDNSGSDSERNHTTKFTKKKTMKGTCCSKIENNSGDDADNDYFEDEKSDTINPTGDTTYLSSQPQYDTGVDSYYNTMRKESYYTTAQQTKYISKYSKLKIIEPVPAEELNFPYRTELPPMTFFNEDTGQTTQIATRDFSLQKKSESYEPQNHNYGYSQPPTSLKWLVTQAKQKKKMDLKPANASTYSTRTVMRNLMDQKRDTIATEGFLKIQNDSNRLASTGNDFILYKTVVAADRINRPHWRSSSVIYYQASIFSNSLLLRHRNAPKALLPYSSGSNQFKSGSNQFKSESNSLKSPLSSSNLELNQFKRESHDVKRQSNCSELQFARFNSESDHSKPEISNNTPKDAVVITRAACCPFLYSSKLRTSGSSRWLQDLQAPQHFGVANFNIHVPQPSLSSLSRPFLDRKLPSKLGPVLHSFNLCSRNRYSHQDKNIIHAQEIQHSFNVQQLIEKDAVVSLGNDSTCPKQDLNTHERIPSYSVSYENYPIIIYNTCMHDS